MADQPVRDADYVRRTGRSGRRLYLLTDKWLWMVGVEWKPQDFWIGAFWKTTPLRFDFWLCLLPMVPIHVSREVR